MVGNVVFQIAKVHNAICWEVQFFDKLKFNDTGDFPSSSERISSLPLIHHINFKMGLSPFFCSGAERNVGFQSRS